MVSGKSSIMIIDLSTTRKDYFEDLTVTEILRQFISRDIITLTDLRQLNTAGKVVTGTKEGDLEQLLNLNYSIDSLSLAGKINTLSSNQLLVLPPEYRIDAEESRQVLVYDTDTLVKLDSIDVKRAVLGTEDVTKSRLSAKQKREFQWSPEKVITAAFNYLFEHRQQLAEHTFAGYSWFGKDNHRRIVSLYRAIQGSELRAFQDFAGYKLLVPVWNKEIRLNKSARSKYREDLSPEQLERRKEKVRKAERYLKSSRPEGKQANDYISRMEVSFSDLIEPVSRTFAYHGGRLMRVPSRSRPNLNYTVQLTGVPLIPLDDNRAYNLVWDLRGNCVCEDKIYRSDRRRTAVDRGNDEDFFCPHEIAALHTLRRMYQDNSKENIPFLPLVIPTAGMMGYLDRLRTQTVLLVYNSHTERFSKRALNHTEIENLLWKKVMAEGYSACFTTDINLFKQQGYDPHLDLIRFK